MCSQASAGIPAVILACRIGAWLQFVSSAWSIILSCNRTHFACSQGDCYRPEPSLKGLSWHASACFHIYPKQ